MQDEDEEPPQDPYHQHLRLQAAKKEEAKARLAPHDRPMDTKHYLDHARKARTMHACSALLASLLMITDDQGRSVTCQAATALSTST